MTAGQMTVTSTPCVLYVYGNVLRHKLTLQNAVFFLFCSFFYNRSIALLHHINKTDLTH